MRLRLAILTTTFVLAAMFIGGLRVQAGPVTNNSTPGQSPFSKLTIYQRLWSIVDNTGRSLTFGQDGRVVASSHDLVFRPTLGTTNPTSGIVVKSDGTNSSIYVSGRLCLVDTVGSHCDVDLPAGGSVWQQSSGSSYGFPYTALVTNTGSLGLRLGSSSSRVPGTALAITHAGAFDNSSADVSAINFDVSGNSYGSSFTGNLVFNEHLQIYDQLYVNGLEVWSTVNQGMGSGLDADLSNGNQVTVETAASCSDQDGFAHVACLCIQTSWTLEGGTYNQAHQAKRCVPLANRP